MARFAQLLLEGEFASAFTSYLECYPGQVEHTRIVVPIRLEEVPYPLMAVVDTGAPWCVLDPNVARQVGIPGRDRYTPEEPLRVRGIQYSGRLVRMGIGLPVEDGKGIEVDATVFVPSLPSGERWPHPNFLGLTGFLERIRFAIDPEENVFYFGQLE
jgi:hypothetical protein